MKDKRMDDLVDAIREHSGLSLSEIEQAGEHGADAGWAEFTYTSDGADFTRKHHFLVWELLSEEAEEMGYPDVAAYVAGFKRADMCQSSEGFDCLLSWWALETAGRYLLDTADERYTAEADRMQDLGEKYGRDSAGWLLDGNSTNEAAERLLRGILEGDPMIMDDLPSSPLSGEWADGLTPTQVLKEADIETEDLEPERESEILDTFEEGYAIGAHDGAETLARNFLGIPEGADLGDCGSRLAEVLAKVRSK